MIASVPKPDPAPRTVCQRIGGCLSRDDRCVYCDAPTPARERARLLAALIYPHLPRPSAALPHGWDRTGWDSHRIGAA